MQLLIQSSYCGAVVFSEQLTIWMLEPLTENFDPKIKAFYFNSADINEHILVSELGCFEASFSRKIEAFCTTQWCVLSISC